MADTRVPRAVIVSRPTEYELLLHSHGTRGQARFFLKTRGQNIEEAVQRHRAQEEALHTVSAAIPVDWRRTRVGRSDLDRFLFEPEDIILVVGQDGLVANAAKYLNGQPVIGVNPNPECYDGILVRHAPKAVKELLPAAAAGAICVESRAMVQARRDDGLELKCLNEIFIGHRSHQSARYVLRCSGGEERQSSSGVIVSTGTGATGWALSISRERKEPVALPQPEEHRLIYFVREAWPSIASGTKLTTGNIAPGGGLEIVSEMGEGGVAFGDGIESDVIALPWGCRLMVGLADARLRLVQGTS